MERPTGEFSRRAFIERGSKAAAGVAAGVLTSNRLFAKPSALPPGANMKFGLVTYQWGRDWNLPTLIRNCQLAGVYGVELRLDHAHGIENHISSQRREEARLRFENSPVVFVGIGQNWAFHYPDPERVRLEIDGARASVRLSHDVGGSGVKVKPDGLPPGVPVERTIEQIGRSLNEVGRFGAEFGQEIRLEVHGRESARLPIIKQIMEVADHPNVVVCWNSNPQDLQDGGLEENFNLVKHRFGKTVHVHELDNPAYPYQQLINLFVEMDYDGWLLLEAATEPVNRILALSEQRELFEQLVSRAQSMAGAR